MIELVRRMDPEDTIQILNFLNKEVKPNLSRDISNYAKGRKRTWLGMEPELFPPHNLKKATRLPEDMHTHLVRQLSWSFDFCLATFSDKEATGISAHRDAGYADFEAMSMNISGTCRFRYWEGRKGFGRTPNTREFNPQKDEPTTILELQPGDILRFNCKNLHSAEPGPSRWNLNFWRKKP